MSAIIMILALTTSVNRTTCITATEAECMDSATCEWLGTGECAQACSAMEQLFCENALHCEWQNLNDSCADSPPTAQTASPGEGAAVTPDTQDTDDDISDEALIGIIVAASVVFLLAAVAVVYFCMKASSEAVHITELSKFIEPEVDLVDHSDYHTPGRERCDMI